ncbi:MAG: aminotransferase class I/II-fold pyridoxal phosphate-dependent enzyme [Rikenellaceae bacterium]
MINGHGNNIYHFDAEAIEFDFSSNVAYNNHSQPILDYLKESICEVCNYPDPEARRLTEMIAKHHCCGEGQILVTNGSAEAFYLIAQHFATQGLTKTAVVTPSFAEYEDSCKAYDLSLDYLSFDELLTSDLTGYSSLWIGVPNNPNGMKISCSQIRQIANRYTNCTLVVDRAYNELCAEREDNWDLPANIIIVDSFTKLYGIPGVRLGYIIAPPLVIDSLSAKRPPWSVNSLSLIAGEYIMRHLDDLHPNIEELIGMSKYLQSQIALIDGFHVTPSDCNFFLIEILGDRDASQLQRYLIEEHKILIRDCSNFRSLTPRHFRLAAQERVACDKLIKALREWR